ncbi:MAG: hypothetical protein ABJC19_12225 [Gemmatimonadota bacterium]
MRRLLALLLLAACGHSDPFTTLPSGATGPLNDAGQLTINPVGLFDWAGDGAGILVYTSRPNEQYDLPLLPGGGRKDPQDTCLGLIPPAGGSMIWQLCDRRMSHYRDSNDVFVSASIGSRGELLYVESIQRPGFFFPVGLEAELWLGSRHAPFAERRHLLRLYRDDNGHPTVSPDQINWLSGVQWAGPDAFIAKALYLRPDGLETPFGIARGVITRDTATLSILPGTAGIDDFVPAEGGSSIVYFRGQTVVLSRPATGGAERVVTTLPDAAGRQIRSLSCQLQLCVAVTQEAESNGIRASNLWRISLATGQATIVRSFLAAAVPTLARLAPDGTRVAVQKTDGRLYLLSDLAL